MRSKNEAVFGEIIEFVNSYFEKNGRSPSTREIEGAVGKSHVTVQRYLVAMRERGEIERDFRQRTHHLCDGRGIRDQPG